jgi:hypothetical protein
MQKPEEFETFKGEFIIQLKKEEMYHKGDLYKKGKNFLSYSGGVEKGLGDIVRITDVTDKANPQVIFPVEKTNKAKSLAA